MKNKACKVAEEVGARNQCILNNLSSKFNITNLID